MELDPNVDPTNPESPTSATNYETVAIQPKWKSVVFWSGVISIIVLGAQLFFNFDIAKSQLLNDILNGILVLIAGLAGWNNTSLKYRW
jgi:hypothetical protein